MSTKYGYVRVSTVKQEEGTSPEAQRAALQAAGVKPQHILEDLGVSGSIAWHERPQGSVLHGAIRKGDTIVVTKPDRAFRSMEDLVTTMKRLDKQGVGLIVLNIGSEPVMSNPYTSLMMQVFGAFSEFERSMILERTREGRRVREEQGFYVGGKAPWGHTIASDGLLVAEPWYDKAIGLIRKMHAEGKPFRTIAAKCAEKFGAKPSMSVLMKLKGDAVSVEDVL